MTQKERYQRIKERLRQAAIDYQIMFAKTNTSWEQVTKVTNYFENMGKRYGLLKEFRENGII